MSWLVLKMKLFIFKKNKELKFFKILYETIFKIESEMCQRSVQNLKNDEKYIHSSYYVWQQILASLSHTAFWPFSTTNSFGQIEIKVSKTYICDYEDKLFLQHSCDFVIRSPAIKRQLKFDVLSG